MRKKDSIDQPQLLTVHEAAQFLNVHDGTIRRWAYASQLKGTKVGVRGDWRFKPEDLDELVQHDSASVKGLVSSGTISIPNSSNDLSHFVQFYEDENFLIKIIREFLQSGDTALVVLLPEHKEKLEKGLMLYRLDIATARKQGDYVFLDAAETLSKFMVNGMPDANLFFEVVGGVITRALRNKKKLKIFGEMVALLWREGNHEAAVKLEELWNELQKIHHFSLFCAYPIHGFSDKNDVISFEKIGQSHSHVIPSESFTTLVDQDVRLREIAILQQKAQALEAEIAKHHITEIKLLEAAAALKISEEFNRRIIENSADCIKVLDLQGHLLTMNQPGLKMLEIDDFSAYFKKDYSIFWSDSNKVDAEKAMEDAKQGQIGRFQGFCPTAKGTPKWWDVVITPMYDIQGKVDRLLAVSRDITAFKELDQRKEDFLSATSHELKTPLTSQKAFIQLLERQVSRDKEDKYLHYIQKINEQTDKLTKLVTDLLDVTKVQAGKLKLTNASFRIDECLRKAVEEIQATTSTHTISFTGNFRKLVLGDREKVSQVIVNLLTNAVKYSPHSDRIIVTLKQHKNQALISVQDFGIGIGKKDQERVFERFYRVSDKDESTYPGLGMGLYITAEIVKQHTGMIWVESEKGKGSIFRFTLPLT